MLTAADMIEQALKKLTLRCEVAESNMRSQAAQARDIDAKWTAFEQSLMSLGFVIDTLQATASIRDDGESVVLKIDRKTYDEMLKLRELIPEPKYPGDM